MKKAAIVGAGIVLFIVLAAAGLFGYLAFAGSRLDASARAYVDQNLPAIIQAWSKEELLKRASPELRQTAASQQFDALFARLSELGPLVSYRGATGQANIAVTTQAGKVVTASYVAAPSFEKADATIAVKLVQRAEAWQIAGFTVNSPLFLK